jgi:proline dehydrogenase
MSLARKLLLAASRSAWLGHTLPRRAPIRRAVRRFMPGERADDALQAAASLARGGIGSLYTRLGENVTSMAEAEAEVAHYVEVIDRVAAAGLPAWPSIKLTHLGLDIDRDACEQHLLTLAAHANAKRSFLWVDMEDSSYVDATIDMFERARRRFPKLGLCLQAYLHRTPDDLERLLPLAPAIRLVKGAYAEPPSVAIPRKRDVDERYLSLGTRMLDAAVANGALPVFGTHDQKMIERLRRRADERALPTAATEFHLLYGIGTAYQRTLAAEGATVRVLISYGQDWFPWYMRRLAERPANVWFVIRNLI